MRSHGVCEVNSICILFNAARDKVKIDGKIAGNGEQEARWTSRKKQEREKNDIKGKKGLTSWVVLLSQQLCPNEKGKYESKTDKESKCSVSENFVASSSSYFPFLCVVSKLRRRENNIAKIILLMVTFI